MRNIPISIPALLVTVYMTEQTKRSIEEKKEAKRVMQVW